VRALVLWLRVRRRCRCGFAAGSPVMNTRLPVARSTGRARAPRAIHARARAAARNNGVNTRHRLVELGTCLGLLACFPVLVEAIRINCRISGSWFAQTI
jgi:hypothetical protein